MIIIISILHHQLFGEQCNYRWKCKCYLQHLNMSILSLLFIDCCPGVSKKSSHASDGSGLPWYLWRAGWLSGPIKGSSILQITKGAFCRFNTILTNYGVGYGSDESWQCRNYNFLPPSFVRSEKGELQYDCEIAILDTRDVWYKSDLIAFMWSYLCCWYNLVTNTMAAQMMIRWHWWALILPKNKLPKLFGCLEVDWQQGVRRISQNKGSRVPWGWPLSITCIE